MKILGLTCGRKMGNGEILVKEALMGAEELGADAEIMRLMDLKIKPCTGCVTCTKDMFLGGPGKCVIRGDDMPFLDEKLMQSDGVILAAPVYSLSPPGYFKLIADRIGPSHDVSFKAQAKKEGNRGIDDLRCFKPRVGGLIAVGGSQWTWNTLGLPLMNAFTWPLQIRIVDQLQVFDVSRSGHVVMNQESLQRARKLGRNVAGAVGKAEGEVNFMGEDPGTCPVCHSNLLLVTRKNPVTCPICGIEGILRVDGDEITVTFDEEELKKSHLTMEGRKEHYFEVRENVRLGQRFRDEIPKRLEKYKSYKRYTKAQAKKG